MTRSHDNLIDGNWIAAESYRSNINPSNTRETVGEYAIASADQISEAIAAARGAFPLWSEFPSQARADILRRAAEALRADSERLGELLSREVGRPPPEAIGEVIRSVQTFEYTSGQVVRTGGEILP